MFVALAHTVVQVSMGCLPAGNTEAMSDTEYPACAQRIAQISRRDL
jgi:hypothetical protein